MKGVNLDDLVAAGATVGPPVRLPPAAGEPAGRPNPRWDLADALRYQLRLAGATGWEPEYRFDPDRRWRFDVAWPAARVAVEAEGGIAARQGHADPERFYADIQKYNAAALAGWLVLRVTGAMIARGEVLALVDRALAARAGKGGA